MMIRTQMLNQVILSRKPIAAFAGTVLDGTVPEDGVVHAGLVALQVCEAGEGFAAVVAGEGFCGSITNLLDNCVFSWEKGG